MIQKKSIPKQKPIPEPPPDVDPADMEQEPGLKAEEELDIIPDEEDPIIPPPAYEPPAPGEGP